MENKTAKRIVTAICSIATLIVIALIVLVINSSSCSRTMSRWEAEYGHGVNRIVTLYSATGEEIGRWEGNIDVDYTGERVDILFFDEHGNLIDRVVVTPGSGSLVVDQV